MRFITTAHIGAFHHRVLVGKGEQWILGLDSALDYGILKSVILRCFALGRSSLLLSSNSLTSYLSK